jgi:hypothetical protein
MRAPRGNPCRESTVGLAASGLWLPASGAGLPLLDLKDVYLHWWPAVDFLLFFALFAGIVHATVGKRFEARGGQLVTLALGAVLAMGALGFEWAFDLNLTALAPVAALVFLILLAVSLFWLLRTLGLSAATSVVGTVLVLAFAVSAISPRFSGALSWLTALLQLGALLGAGYLVASVMFGRGQAKGGVRLDAEAQAIASGTTDQDTANRRWSGDEQRALREEKGSIAASLRPITKQAQKSAERVLSELQLVKKSLARGPPSEKDRHIIGAALARVAPERTELANLLDQVKQLDQRLLSFDEKTLPSLTARAGPMSPRQRGALYRLVLEERDKIGIEKKIEYVESFVEKYDAQGIACTQEAADQLVRGDLETAKRWVDAAIGYEEQAIKMIERTRAVERMLQRLTRLELRQLKQAA